MPKTKMEILTRCQTHQCMNDMAVDVVIGVADMTKIFLLHNNDIYDDRYYDTICLDISEISQFPVPILVSHE